SGRRRSAAGAGAWRPPWWSPRPPVRAPHNATNPALTACADTPGSHSHLRQTAATTSTASARPLLEAVAGRRDDRVDEAADVVRIRLLGDVQTQLAAGLGGDRPDRRDRGRRARQVAGEGDEVAHGRRRREGEDVDVTACEALGDLRGQRRD